MSAADTAAERWWEEADPDAAPLEDSWDFVDLAPFLDGTYVRPKPAVLARTDGVATFYRGRVNEVHGASEAAKTTLLRAAAAEEMLAGHHVMWMEWEDSADVIAQGMRPFGVSPEVIAERLHVIRPHRAHTDEDLARIVAAAEEWSITLAVIDAVTESMSTYGLNPNDGIDVARWVGGIPTALAHCAAEPAVAWVDHTKRGNEAGGDAIGSVHKRNAITGVGYEVRNVRPFVLGHGGMSRLIVTKDRPGSVRASCADSDYKHFGDFHLDPIYVPEVEHSVTWRIVPSTGGTLTDKPAKDTGHGIRPCMEMQRLSRALHEQGPMNARAIRGIEGNNDRLDLAAVILAKEGYSRIEARARGEQVHHFVEQYIAADDPKNPAREGGS